MALGSENMVYQYCPTSKYQHHRQQLAQYTPPREILRTRNVNQRTIAPAAPYTKPTSHLCNSSEGNTTFDADNPSVVRRNARERNRVKQVNNGFSNLRQHIPTAIVAEISNGRRGIGPGADKKLSKVDTLRMAAEYIRRLKKLIDEVDSSDASSVSSCGTLNYSSSSCAASSTSGSPTPPMPSQQRQQVLNNSDNTHIFYQQQTQFFNSQQHHQPLSYAGSFQQHNLISPANSTSSSSAYTTDLFAHHHQESSPQHYQSSSFDEYNHDTPATTPIKFEPVSFDDYHTNNSSSSSADDEELLDYISLWQDERID